MIHIVTPCTRISNLKSISASIQDSNEPNIYWWIMLDSTISWAGLSNDIFNNINGTFVPMPNNAIAGHLHRNYVLDRIGDDSWFYSVDDDNILHPEFLQELTTERNAVVVQQLNKDGSLRLDANIPKLNQIDTAQFAIRKKLIGDIRFPNVYDGDGRFAEEVYNKHKEEFTFIHKPLSYYNYLR